MSKRINKKADEKPLTNRGVRFSDSQWGELSELGDKLDRDIGYLVREAVDEYLQKRRKK